MTSPARILRALSAYTLYRCNPSCRPSCSYRLPCSWQQSWHPPPTESLGCDHSTPAHGPPNSASLHQEHHTFIFVLARNHATTALRSIHELIHHLVFIVILIQIVGLVHTLQFSVVDSGGGSCCECLLLGAVGFGIGSAHGCVLCECMYGWIGGILYIL